MNTNQCPCYCPLTNIVPVHAATPLLAYPIYDTSSIPNCVAIVDLNRKLSTMN